MKKAINGNSRRPILSYEKSLGVSLTDPDFGMSVREIMSKFAQGITIPSSVGTYSGKNPDTRFWELEDFHEFEKINKQKIDELKAELDDKKEKFNSAVRENRHQKEIDRLKNEINTLKPKDNEQ